MSAPMSRLRDAHQAFSGLLSGMGRVVIAGGAVRDALMWHNDPKDYDVFVLGQSVDAQTLKQMADLVTPHFDGVPPALEFHTSEPFLACSVMWNGTMVQVLASEFTTEDELIDSFDWHVSRFSFDGERVTTPEDIATIGRNKPLLLRKVTFPLSTLRRGFRFSERFGMEFRHEDVMALCRQVVESKS